MTAPLCRFVFKPDVNFAEVTGTFKLAVMAAEALHGPDAVALDAVYHVDPEACSVTVDRSTHAGGSIALLFLGFACREFGRDAFRMPRLTAAEAEVTR